MFSLLRVAFDFRAVLLKAPENNKRFSYGAEDAKSFLRPQV